MIKKLVALMVCSWICACSFAQVTILTFSGKDANNNYVRLDSVVISNITKSWQETIYYPDTILIMNGTGIEEYGTTPRFALSQNIPNPFNGISDFSLQLPEDNAVTISVFDLTGKKITELQQTLAHGTYIFRVFLSIPQAYLLSVNSGTDHAAIKIINTGNAGKNRIEYLSGGNEMSITYQLKSDKGQTQNPFDIGDTMEYVGYTTINYLAAPSGVISQVQAGSEGIELAFSTLVSDGQPCSLTPTLTDVDGNIYNTLQLGHQCWMKENLKTTKYANNTAIALSNNLSTTLAYRYYPDNDSSKVTSYGYLYNWLAVMGGSSSSSSNPSTVQGICPIGWHVPSDSELTELIDYVSSQRQYVCGDDSTYIAKALADSAGWDTTPGTCIIGSMHSSNNATGFSALPAGLYYGLHSSTNFSYFAYFWTATQSNNANACICDLNYGIEYVVRFPRPKDIGFSVRCLRDDSTSVPTVNTYTVTNITQSSATCSGDVIFNGNIAVTSRGICWSMSHNPTTADNHTSNGSGTGSFTSSLTGLVGNTTYYVRAYATNYVGTGYGNEVSFTTSPPTIPTVSTNNPIMNTQTTATCDGVVTSDGGATVTARGVCWSSSQNPTITDNYTTDGSGTGSFTSNISGLTPNTIYYVRAYATNSIGTAYGNELSFTSNDGLPCVNTPTLTDIDGNTYNTVQIGNQCWMRENLRVTEYANGTPIPLLDSTTSIMAYRYYPDNDSTTVSLYGYLYNWLAVMGSSDSSSSNPSGVQGICPTGWHVPSDSEWTQLSDYVSSRQQYICGSNITQIGKALAATIGWLPSSGTCDVGKTLSTNNATGFSALPAGIYDGMSGTNLNTVFWSSSLYNDNNATTRALYFYLSDFYRNYEDVSYGVSVRCVRD